MSSLLREDRIVLEDDKRSLLHGHVVGCSSQRHFRIVYVLDGRQGSLFEHSVEKLFQELG